ncbi:MAG TPA: thioether cross-link-forming SCIFF peptide maturase [Defluviitaleaceae bacterium]|nr:thioether cross-link-forming SCIFF peptide maturase [Candidatus Epulonipiscium sp.]HOQ16079.1 thioether cross-link-forming SCIFF peptide maturase [Defluviitaleaceae bacterium]HPT75829.1 thioether cross-link-forming SCIFF peptide maturase [Defluviitaleaceae bacterium]HQD50749.1 thioether cross-link-forming SCIFF peptide maturase [Defluviitaleaceae bacterium]
MIHKYSIDGMNIVLDIYSGAVHVVDDIVYDLLDFYKEIPNDELIEKFKEKYEIVQIEEAIEEIESLEKEGLLFTEDAYVDYLTEFKNRNPVVKALCLHVAHDCNLKCKYCFAGEGAYKGSRSIMTKEVGIKAIDFLIEASGNRRNLEIDFFGGEPLLNFELVKEIIEYARSIEKEHNKNFRFTITTNGLLLNDEIQNYINENMHNVVLSIDGRKEIHDKMRYTKNNQGSYDLILPKLKKMAESRKQQNYYVRGTFTRENLDFAQDVIHLADLGFQQISVEPVVAPLEMPYALREEDLPVLFNQYEVLAKELIRRNEEGQAFNFFHFMIDLSQGPCVAKRLAGCGSGSEYLAVTPEGDLYPCHQFVGLEDFKIGTVFEGITNHELQKQFQDCNVYAKEECRSCWAKFYCSGGCAANAYQFHKDIHIPYKIGCELEKKRVECALYLKAKLAGL